MRAETSDWLLPLIEGAIRRHIPTAPAGHPCAGPATETRHVPGRDDLERAPDRGGQVWAVDWIRYGAALRRGLGWDDCYPGLPDFPELRGDQLP